MDEKFYVKIDGLYYDAGTEADLINSMNAQGIEDFEITDTIDDGDKVFVTPELTGLVEKQDDGFFLLLSEDGTILADITEETIERLGRLGLIY